MKKTSLMFTAVALAALGAIAQDKPAAPKAAPATAPAAVAAPADPVVITAGSLKITKSEFEDAVKSLPAEYQGYAMGQGKREFAEDFVRMKMLAAEGLKNGLDKDPAVSRQLQLMRENLVANAQITAIDKTITVSDAALKAYYDAHKNEYEQVKARHILIAFKGSRAAQANKPELTDEQAKAKADEIRKKLVAGADFAATAKAESDDVGSGANGGDLGTFGRGQMVPEFDKAAFEGKIGEISPVIRTEFGYHIIQVQEHSVTPFEGLKGTIEKAVHQEMLKAKLDSLKTAAAATYDAVYFEAPKPKYPLNPGATDPTAPSSAAPAPDAKKPATDKQ